MSNLNSDHSELEKEKVQSMTSAEVISCLWNKSSVEKCRVGLTDTILFDQGNPTGWYITGKTGEITKKRGTDLDVISKRWIKIASQTESPIVAILRQENGTVKLLPLRAWNSFISQFSPDRSVLSLHSFVKGENNLIYRNKYKLRDKFGRVTTSTHAYVLKADQNDSDSVSIMIGSDLSFVECRANQICNVLDLATSTVVRYLELMMQVRVLSIEIDFSIDTKSQIWMMWASGATFTTRFEELTIEELGQHPAEARVVHDRQGRMSWAGLKYFELEVEESEKPPYVYENGRTLSPVIVSPSKLESRQLNDSSVAAAQLNTAASVNKANAEGRNRPKRRVNDNPSYKVAIGQPTADKPNTKAASAQPDALMGTFPQPFKCKGDYCSIHIDPADPTLKVGIPHAESHIVDKLFSKQELLQLRKDRMFTQMMSFGTPGPALAAISMKNIMLARQERRGLAAKAGQTASFDTYPVSPRSKLSFKEQIELSMKASAEGQGRALAQEIKLQEVRLFDYNIYTVCMIKMNLR